MKNMSMLERLYLYLLMVPALVMFFGMFFNMIIVGTAYFMALVVGVVILIMDRHESGLKSNNKLVYLTNDSINLVAVITIMYYEFLRDWGALDILLIVLAALSLVQIVIDAVCIKNGRISKQGLAIIDIFNVGIMICILTYFFKVSSLWFAIDAICFLVAMLVLKLVLNHYYKKTLERPRTEEQVVEDIIHSAGENEKDTE